MPNKQKMMAGPKAIILLGLVVLLKDFVQTAIPPTSPEAESDALIDKVVEKNLSAWEKERPLTPRAKSGDEYRRDLSDPEKLSKQTSRKSQRIRRKDLLDVSQGLTSDPNSKEETDDRTLTCEDESLPDWKTSAGHDVYNCSASTDCICHQEEHNQRIQANCSSLRLYRIPQDLPPKIYKLTLSENRLRSFNLSILLDYPGLAFVDAQQNKMTSLVQSTAVTASSSLLILLLGKNNFTSIGEDAFKMLPSLRQLSLNDNRIQSLTNLSFSGLDQLAILDLSLNDIKHIEQGTFDSLPKLHTLLLNNNPHLSYYPARMAPRLFKNLRSLIVLNLAGSSGGAIRYPDEALGYLTNLRELNMDGLANGAVLGPQVKHLKKLKSLKVGVGEKNHCNIGNLTSSFFKNTPHLTSLEIQFCLMASISSDAFVNTTKLQRLKISYSKDLGVSKALRSLASLQNSSLKSLELVHLVHHNGLPCRYLTEEDSKFIKNTMLELLDLSDNLLAMVEMNFYKALPQTLKTLVLRNNRFSVNTFQLSSLASMNNLTKLDLTSQDIGKVKALQPKPHENKDSEACEVMLPDMIDPEAYSGGFLSKYEFPAMSKPFLHTELPNSEDRTDTGDKTREKMNTDGLTILPINTVQKFSMPPNLQTLWAPQFLLYGELVLFHRENKKLEEIDFSFSVLPSWGNGKLYGNVRNISLEGNYCQYIRPGFFPGNNSLELLNIRNNILGPQFANDEQGIIFKRLARLLWLDLSMNLIYKLPPDFFKGLSRLRELILSDNKLQSLNFSVSSMPHLTTIDASKNSIAWIGRRTRDGLDTLALHHPVSLDLRKNPLPCTCKGIEILSWLATTNVHLTGEDFLVCRFESNDYDTIGNLSQRVMSMKRRCTPWFNVVFISVACPSLFLVLSSVFLVYRYRWKLRYLHKVKFSKWFGFHPSTQTSRHKFDAFVIYAEEDRDFVLHTMLTELETNRGHKLCVAERDFMPGTYITTNITCAVQSSTFTLPVISPDFLDDEYSEYGVQMALCEMVFEKRPVLHLFLRTPMDYRLLFRDLLVVLRDDKYTEYPPQAELEDDNINKNFWDALSQMIGHSDSQLEPRLDLSGEL
ncbi:toll-like receptor 4 [Aplysia californica]|uniref:Toll-like receptor 4 n=1 Tax=Aplysia californica TaxID=6500 RepID=A0ABM0JD10_APLCA|nr:toll-like receptor 4 [Aplysia californica]